MKKLKVVFIKASGSFKRGDQSEVDADKFQQGHDLGLFVTEGEWTTIQARHEDGKNLIVKVVNKAKTVGAIEAKDDAILTSHLKRYEEGTPADALVELVDKDISIHAAAKAETERKAALQTRQTGSGDPGDGAHVTAMEMGFRETVIGYLKVSEPYSKTRRNGGILAAAKGKVKDLQELSDLSLNRSRIMERIVAMVKGGADYSFENIIKAADYVDPGAGNPLGTLNTDMLLAFNLGYLENQLAMLDDITTDISNQPVAYQQTALSRYIKVPGWQLKVAGTGWSTSNEGQSVDVNIKMDKYIGIPLSWNNTILAATTRNLPAEFKTPQLYGIGEAIIYYLVQNIINGNTRIANDGVTTLTITFQGAPTDGVTVGPFPGMLTSTLKTFTADLPCAMDLCKFPGGDEGEGDPLMRFAWVHSVIYAAAAGDTNLLLNQTIQAISNKLNPNTFATGRINRLGNISLRKSQLMTDQLTLATSGSPVINTVTVGSYKNATTLGFAGTRSGLMFTSRLPLDYTKVMPEIPNTAAVEVVTSPKLGIQLAIVKYLDHNQETANMRAATMFGTSIGDERQGFLLTK